MRRTTTGRDVVEPTSAVQAATALPAASVSIRASPVSTPELRLLGGLQPPLYLAVWTVRKLPSKRLQTATARPCSSTAMSMSKTSWPGSDTSIGRAPDPARRIEPRRARDVVGAVVAAERDERRRPSLVEGEVHGVRRTARGPDAGRRAPGGGEPAEPRRANCPHATGQGRPRSDRIPGASTASDHAFGHVLGGRRDRDRSAPGRADGVARGPHDG